VNVLDIRVLGLYGKRSDRVSAQREAEVLEKWVKAPIPGVLFAEYQGASQLWFFSGFFGMAYLCF